MCRTCSKASQKLATVCAWTPLMQSTSSRAPCAPKEDRGSKRNRSHTHTTKTTLIVGPPVHPKGKTGQRETGHTHKHTTRHTHRITQHKNSGLTHRSPTSECSGEPK